MDTVLSASQLAKSVNVLDDVRWIYKSWQETSIDTIRSCFKKSGFVRDAISTETLTECDLDTDDPYDDIPIQQLIDAFPNYDFRSVSKVENTLPTEEIYDRPDWEDTFLSTVCSTNPDPLNHSDTDDDDSLETPSSNLTAEKTRQNPRSESRPVFTTFTVHFQNFYKN
jgi:hypothetical protein